MERCDEDPQLAEVRPEHTAACWVAQAKVSDPVATS